ncbi:MAG: hypothetical protein GY842_06890, partial [bacterium]|nr:hypothetical protein [bacterium]
RTVRHYHYRCDGRPRYRVYTSFGGWGWPGGGPYEYDPYHDQRETARFLAQLLESVTIEPQHVVIGHVVFAYRPREDDQLTLRITLGPNEASPTTQPADQTTVSMVFEVR